jgi:hypothetical protein
MPYAIQKLQNFNVSYAGELNTSIVNFTYSLDSFHINKLWLDTNHSYVDMTSGDIVANLNNFTLEWVGKVKFATDPKLFFGDGSGWFNLSKLNYTVKINFGLGENKLPTLKIKQSAFDISNKSLNMSFYGTNDIFTLIDMAQKFALPAILAIIQGNMTKETINSTETMINGLLGSIPHEVPIPTTGVAFDIGFTDSPAVTSKGYIPILINGTARCTNETSCKRYEPMPVPPKKEEFKYGKGSFQLHLSDYIFNSIFVALWQDSFLNFAITPAMVHGLTNGSIELDTKLLGVFIPEIRRRYGPDKPITLKISATAPPLLSINETCLSISSKTSTEMIVNLTKNSTESILTANLNTEFNIFAKLSNNLIFLQIADYKFSLTSTSTIPNITVEEVNSFFNSIFKLVIPQVNTFFEKGFPIPPLKPFFDLKESELVLFNRYLLFDFVPIPCEQGFKQLVDLAFTKLFQQYQKLVVSPSKTLPKIPEWLKIEYKDI